MSIDIAHPPPRPNTETAVRISQLAPKFLKYSPKPAAWPWSLLSGDPSAETWASLETLYVQCLRTGDDKSAKEILERLVARFGEKNERVMAYQGMWEEATAQSDKDLERVLSIYGKILENDPTNLVRPSDLTRRNQLLTYCSR
jgi:ER membrane protein complex subunit 2